MKAKQVLYSKKTVSSFLMKSSEIKPVLLIDQIQLLLRIRASAFKSPISYKGISRVFVSLLPRHSGVPYIFH